MPRIRLLPGERTREFVLSREQEGIYLDFAPQPLKDAAVLMLDTGLRVGEVLALEWRDVMFEPVPGAPHGFVMTRYGKTVNARRFIPITSRVKSMLESQKAQSKSQWVFADESEAAPLSRFTLRDQHVKIRKMMKLSTDFVIHSLRHTALTRLGEAGADAFSIMKLAGHSTVTVSQKYVHPSAEALGLAIQRLEAMNAKSRKKLSETPKTAFLATVPTTVGAENVDRDKQVV